MTVRYGNASPEAEPSAAAPGRLHDARLDPHAKSAFDRLTRLAAQCLAMPIAMLGLAERDHLWIASRVGTELELLPCADALCAHTLCANAVVILSDAAQNPGFAASPLLSGLSGGRIYAGAPLVARDGSRLGILCAVGPAEQVPVDETRASWLAGLARSVVAELELYQSLLEVDRLVAQRRFWIGVSQVLADAPDFSAALQQALELCTERTGASLSMIAELDRGEGLIKYVTRFVAPGGSSSAIEAAIWSTPQPAAQVSFGPAMEQNQISDSGPIADAASVQDLPHLHRLVAAGIRRKLAFPFDLDDRRFGLVLAYTRADLRADDVNFVHELIARLRPLLRGRLREAALEHANRALRTSRACGAALEHVSDETALMQEVCRIAVEVGDYATAWIGLAAHDDIQSVTLVASAGFDANLAPRLQSRWADSPRGRGPTGTAIRERRIFIAEDVPNDPQFEPWRELLQDLGVIACIGIPLVAEDGEAIGALTICARERNSFDVEERQLLGDLVADLMRGLATLRGRADRRAALTAQRTSEQRIAQLLETSPVVLYSLRLEAGQPVPVDVSSNVTRLLGYSTEEVLTPGWWQTHVHPADRASVLAAPVNVLADGRYEHRYRIAHRSGEYRWIHDEMRLSPTGDGTADSITGAWIDVTDHLAAERKIYQLAYLDPLTDLPNRRLLFDRLGQALKTSRRMRHHGALLMIDIDHFKAVNDMMGHPGGDAALVEVARRLQSALRAEDTVARLGGDEFVVLISRLSRLASTASEQARRIADKLSRAIADSPISIQGRERYLTASIGVTLFSKADDTVETVLSQADTAMYQAKANDDERIRFFEPAMQKAVADQLAVEVALRDALAHDRFEIWLQSQVDPGGQMIAAEALLRLRKSDGKLLPPDVFIGIAETSGLIVPIGRWVLQAACDLIAATADAPWRIAVNVSPRQFRDADFVDSVEQALRTSQADPARLTIEITEGLLVRRIEEAAETMRRLADHGIRFSVDDFGTGYSSLRYLQRLPIHEVKIDRSFVAQLPGSVHATVIVEAILAMADRLGIAVVAEGVETTEQARYLTTRRCTSLQGYLFGKPTPADTWQTQISAILARPLGTAADEHHRHAAVPPDWRRH